MMGKTTRREAGGTMEAGAEQNRLQSESDYLPPAIEVIGDIGDITAGTTGKFYDSVSHSDNYTS
jgi:hypothetical protein